MCFAPLPLYGLRLLAHRKVLLRTALVACPIAHSVLIACDARSKPFHFVPVFGVRTGTGAKNAL
jgi:hypothetical protein